MIYLLKIPNVLAKQMLTKESCLMSGFDWHEGEMHHDLMILSCTEDKLKNAIEDALGAVHVKHIKGDMWEVKEFDELMPNCDVIFNEKDVVTINVFKMSYSDLEDYFSKPCCVSRSPKNHWFVIRE